MNLTAVKIDEATRQITSIGATDATASELHNLDKLGWFGRRLREQTEKYQALDVEGRREMSHRMRAEFVNWRRFYVEHVVFAFHLHAFAFLAFIPAALIGSTWFTLTVIILVLAYLLVGLHRVYEDSWSLTLLKFLLLVIPYGFFQFVGLAVASLASFFTV